MLEEFVKATVNKLLIEKYPHVLLPPAVNAKVTKASETGKVNEIKEDVKEAPWGSGECIINQKEYMYTLSVLNEEGSVNEDYPPIPKVKSYTQYKVGDIVTVVMGYGKTNVQIVGKIG